MTVDLPSVSSSFNDEKGVVNAMDPEANDRMQPLLESVLEEYFTCLLHEEACVIINVAEDLNILNGVASQNDSSDAILVSENLAFVDIQTTLCKKSVHQKSITYVIPMSDQFSSALQKSADLDNASINEMTDELQPPEYFVLLGCRAQRTHGFDCFSDFEKRTIFLLVKQPQGFGNLQEKSSQVLMERRDTWTTSKFPGLKPLDIGLETFQGSVPAAMINSNAYGRSEPAVGLGKIFSTFCCLAARLVVFLAVIGKTQLFDSLLFHVLFLILPMKTIEWPMREFYLTFKYLPPNKVKRKDVLFTIDKRTK
ncbi:hypothetical protein H5410_042479, partial [Solanum commersonii]